MTKIKIIPARKLRKDDVVLTTGMSSLIIRRTVVENPKVSDIYVKFNATRIGEHETRTHTCRLDQDMVVERPAKGKQRTIPIAVLSAAAI